MVRRNAQRTDGRGERVAVPDPGAANRAWAEIEHQLVDAAVQAPITNPLLTHAVSDRAENVQVHPQWGLMLSLIWVQ